MDYTTGRSSYLILPKPSGVLIIFGASLTTQMTPSFEHCIAELKSHLGEWVVMDFKSVMEIDGSILRALPGLRQWLDREGIGLRACSVGAHLKGALLGQFVTATEFASDLSQALRSLSFRRAGPRGWE